MSFLVVLVHVVMVWVAAYDLISGNGMDHPIRVAGEISAVVGWGWILFVILTDAVKKGIRGIQ
jgi:hypothetical protein